MQRFKVQGVPPYDGVYEVDWEARPFTTRELGWIKRFAGYLPAELDESKFSDPELLVVLVLIALRRNGKIEVSEVPRVFDRLIDAPFDQAFDTSSDELEDDAGPPERSSNGSPVASGLSSSASSETSAPSPNPSGTPGSGFTDFDRPTSGT